MTMRMNHQQLSVMVEIVTKAPESLPEAQREIVSQLHSLGYIVTFAKRYAVTGRGQCALVVSGYRGDMPNVKIQPSRYQKGNIKGNSHAERAGEIL